MCCSLCWQLSPPPAPPARPRVAAPSRRPGPAQGRRLGVRRPAALGGSPPAPAAAGFLARVSAGTGALFPAAMVGGEKGVPENLWPPKAPVPAAARGRGVGARDGKDRGVWSRMERLGLPLAASISLSEK